jgi:hypothetical protein
MRHISSLQNDWSEFRKLAMRQYQEFLNQVPPLPPLNIKISEMSLEQRQHFEFWKLKENNHFLYMQLEDEFEKTYDLMFIEESLSSEYWAQFQIKRIEIRDDDFPHKVLGDVSVMIEEAFNETNDYQDHPIFNHIKIPFWTPLKVIIFTCILLILIFLLFSLQYFLIAAVLGFIAISIYLMFCDFNPKKTAKLNKLHEYKQAYFYSIIIELRKMLKLKLNLDDFDFKNFTDSNVLEGENFFWDQPFKSEDEQKIKLMYFLLFVGQYDSALKEPHQASIHLDSYYADYLAYKDKDLL